jgi:hypothetical protein
LLSRDDPPVAGGIGEFGRDQRERRLRGLVPRDQPAQRVRSQRGKVAVQDEQDGVRREQRRRLQDGVTGAALLGLEDELGSRVLQGLLHGLGLEAHHRDQAPRLERARRLQHVRGHGPAGDVVEELDALRAQTGALPRRQHEHEEAGGGVRRHGTRSAHAPACDGSITSMKAASFRIRS